MKSRKLIWIVADATDARLLLATACDGPVLALTPVARAVFVDSGIEQIDPRRRFTDCAQARTVAAVRRARQKLVEAVAALPGARAMQREIALDHFLRAAHTGYRLWFTLGPVGPWMVPEGAEWRHCETRNEAYAALLKHMLAPLVVGQAEVARANTPPLLGLYRALRDALLRRACRGRVAFISGARKGMFGLLDAIAGEAESVRIVIVQSTGGGWRDYLRLVRNVWRVLRGERFIDVSLLAPPRGDMLATAERLIASIDDFVIEAALGFYRELLAYRLAQAEPAISDAGKIVAAVSPRHFASADASRVSDWALLETCGERGITRWILSRNTHVKPLSHLAEDACQSYFSARNPEGLIDRYLFWTPHGAAAAKAMLAPAHHAAIEPVAAMPVMPLAAVVALARTRRIIVADTFAAFWFTHSWAFQTSDEYMDGLVELVRTVEAMPDTTLLIRGKARHELDLKAYHRLLPSSAKVEIKIRDVPFSEDVIASDLLVAFRSTTIEEALHMRRPVLLWGSSSRYCYLPARREVPRLGDRGTLYTATTAAELARLLPAILDQHAGKALTDAEIAPHVWPRGTPGISELARRMLSAPQHAIQHAA